MEFLSPILLEDYNQTLRQLPDDPFSSDQISYREVIKAHFLVCEYFESTTGHQSFHGVKDYNLLCSAVCRQKTEFGGRQKWNGKFEIMATLFFGLVRNHAFHDGNKRTALLVLLSHLYKNHRIPVDRQLEWENMTLSVAEGNWGSLGPSFDELKRKKDLSDADAAVLSIAKFLRKKTRKLDRQYNPVTYSQFEAAIKPFGYSFANPSGNYIDIVRNQTRRGLFFGRKTIEQRRICQIGFPGMKRVMSVNIIKDTLKKLDLVPEKGYDKEVVFGDSEPLFQLIRDFEGPLIRLQDK